MRLRTLLPAVHLAVVLAVVGCGATTGSDGTTGVAVGDVSPDTTPTSRTDPGGPEGADGTVERGTEVSGEGYHGWIIDPDAREDWMFEEGAEAVWATEDQVAEVEAILAEELPVERDRRTEHQREQLDEVLADLDGYERQYAGLVVDGHTLVHVNALCTTDVAGGDLSTRFVVVDDGGSCFWNATVDVEAGTLDQLGINGSA